MGSILLVGWLSSLKREVEAVGEFGQIQTAQLKLPICGELKHIGKVVQVSQRAFLLLRLRLLMQLVLLDQLMRGVGVVVGDDHRGTVGCEVGGWRKLRLTLGRGDGGARIVRLVRVEARRLRGARAVHRRAGGHLGRGCQLAHGHGHMLAGLDTVFELFVNGQFQLETVVTVH